MAAGPKLVFAEFADKAETMRKTAESLDHGLSYAPGCDLIEYDEWQAVSAEVTRIMMAATALRDLAKGLSEAAPAGTAEEVRAARYPTIAETRPATS